MKQKRLRNLPWRNGGTTIAEKKPRSGRRWPEVVDGGRRVWWQWMQRRERERTRERPRERESDRERRGMEGARSCGGCTGRRWSTVARGCGGSGCNGERERARERGSDRERREMEGARSHGGCTGQRRSTVTGGCGGSGCSKERESGRSCRGVGAGKKKGSRISNPK